MRLCAYLLLSFMFLALSCAGSKYDDPECADAADAAAECYSYLIEGDNDEFLSSFADTDSLPADYSKALGANMSDFLKVQKERYCGIVSAEPFYARRDTASGVVNVFLTLTYGDKSQERVLVPMIKKKDKWLMK